MASFRFLYPDATSIGYRLSCRLAFSGHGFPHALEQLACSDEWAHAVGPSSLSTPFIFSSSIVAGLPDQDPDEKTFLGEIKRSAFGFLFSNAIAPTHAVALMRHAPVFDFSTQLKNQFDIDMDS